MHSVPQSAEKLQESPCIFALTPRQVEMIRNSRCVHREQLPCVPSCAGLCGPRRLTSTHHSMPGEPSYVHLDVTRVPWERWV